MNVQQLFDDYDRRFHEAMLAMPAHDPAGTEGRAAIERTLRESLGINDQWIPEIEVDVVDSRPIPGGTLRLVRSRSWPGVVGSALWYLPEGVDETGGDEPRPFVLVGCGHGNGGKHSGNYQAMARHLMSLGAIVLCPDNIGQGERTAMGHRDVVKPFACGISVQGLIVMETLGWLEWARQQPMVDTARIAATGNSGGGTLTLILAALCPQFAAVACTGYPSTFEFIARKEKKHCHCNLLPGIVGRMEMWHALGCFAPRPLLLAQGNRDPLFPEDLFHHVGRKVRSVYDSLDAGDRFEAHVVAGDHPWDARRIGMIGEFLAKALALPTGSEPVERAYENLLDAQEDVCLGAEDKGLDADALAERLTGQRIEGDPQLWDVYPPAVSNPAALPTVTPRGSTAQIFAQYEAFLG